RADTGRAGMQAARQGVAAGGGGENPPLALGAGGGGPGGGQIRIGITPERVHAGEARPSDAPRGKARLRFRLTCVTRIFEKSVFTKFAHGSRLAAGVGERLVARASLLETAGDLLALQITLSRHFDCYRIVIFSRSVGDARRSRQSQAR